MIYGIIVNGRNRSACSSQPQGKQKKKALEFKSIYISDDSSEIVDSGDVSEMLKKLNIELKKIKTKYPIIFKFIWILVNSIF
ncbi:16267_t:CDS:2 [Funneliformis geosporum]|nr:16267_t:CDS:2 [Funneliformis geosporum]